MDEFDKAKDKIMMGSERKGMVMSEEEKTNTAYHEAGHAIVGRMVPEHDPVYKVSIIPRGRALGVTMYLPEQDRYSHSKQHLESMISSLFGGRIAETITLGEDGVTTGASNDIERATDIARKMVTQWGLSSKMGPMLYAEEEGEVFLGNSMTKSKNMSDDTARAIDAEIKSIIDRNYERAEKILIENRDVLETMKDCLMKYETIDAKQIDDLMARIEPRPPADWVRDNKDDSGKPSGGASVTSSDKKDDKSARPNVGNPGDATS
jgi:cell division protease FtsH